MHLVTGNEMTELSKQHSPLLPIQSQNEKGAGRPRNCEPATSRLSTIESPLGFDQRPVGRAMGQ